MLLSAESPCVRITRLVPPEGHPYAKEPKKE
jgi:hypothetical protein